jgi:hypothetical protein
MLYPKPTRHTNQPNTRTQPGPGGPWLPLPSSVPSDTQPPSSPEGLTPGRCFKDTPSRYTARFRSGSGRRAMARSAQPYVLRPKYLPVPPFFFIQGILRVVAGARRPTVSVNPRLPPVPQSSFVHPLMRINLIKSLPPNIARVHRILPCTPQSPIRAANSHFAAVPLWGPGPVDRTDAATCLVDLPPPEDGRRYECTLFYGGDTRVDATIREVAPE